MARGKFITIEGIEGVGKSTHLAFVAERLRAAGLAVRTTREPGGTPTAELIRAVLLQSGAGEVDALCELLLMFAARASHIAGLIRPCLARGEWVVCDRFIDATYAYQGGGRGLPVGTIEALERLVLGELRPDLTLLLDAPLEVTEQRRTRRGSSDRFEREERGFFARVQACYRDRAQADPARIALLDAGGALPEVRAGIAQRLDEFIEKNS